MSNYPCSHWVLDYLGKPYHEGADGPDVYDCWGLVRDICANKIDCAMPLINIGRQDNQAAISEAVKGWKKVNKPYEEFDILTMRGMFGRHIGICVKVNERLLMLHAEVPQVQLVELERLSAFGYKDVQGWRYGK